MKASEVTLNDVRRVAVEFPHLSIGLSFVQVEEGLKGLEGFWDGFCDANDHFDENFDDERDCAQQFGLAISEFFDIPEHSLGQVG